MKPCLVVYTTTTGNTRSVVDTLVHFLGMASDILGLGDLDQGAIDSHGLVICCVSSWGNGLMQDDWHLAQDHLRTLGFTGHPVAVCGLGDQRLYPDHFADGAGILAEMLVHQGGRLIGRTGTTGYNFSSSRAAQGKEFVGLILDEDNQHPLTEDRVRSWTKQLAKELG